jgi:integrase
MNRHRKKDRQLPARVYKKNGGYYYVPREPIRNPATGKVQAWIRLCAITDGEGAMLRAFAEFKGDKRLAEGSMPYACAEFKAKKLHRYSTETVQQYSRFLDVIADEFEDFQAAQVTTKECAGFLRDKFSDKANTAKKYTALLGKLFRFIIGELGLRQDNPIDQLDMSDYETRRREVLATHEQIRQIREAGMFSKERKDTGKAIPTASGPMFACIIDMSYLLWARAIDIRTLKETQIDGGRIRIKPSKTSKTSGKVVDITITPSIQAVIDVAREIKRKYGIISPYLFPTQNGTPYTKSGLNSMWTRAKDRIDMKDDVVFKDIRALGATDAAKRGENRKHIQDRLAHASGQTTEIYIKESIPDISSIDMDLPWK